MNYKNQIVSKDLSLVEIKFMLTNMVIIVIVKGEIKNFEGEGVIYTILIVSKYEILPKLGELQGICLVVLSFA